jgi:mannose/fructose/N-acetylgalactosamine-specific phosphotransferase system component IID
MEIVGILLSGVVGALVATYLSICYQQTAEKIKNRKYVMVAVTEWLDNIYLRLQLLCAEKEQFYKQKKNNNVSAGI